MTRTSTISHRCIRCGSEAINSLYCDRCFTMEWARSVMEVETKPVQSPWVKRALDNELPAKAVYGGTKV